MNLCPIETGADLLVATVHDLRTAISLLDTRRQAQPENSRHRP